MTFPISLHFVSYATKPDDSDAARISAAIGTFSGECSVEDLAEAVAAGQSFSPAVFLDGHRANDCWFGQTLIAIDVDNEKPGERMFTPDDALGMCDALSLPPALIYSTFSSTPEHPKFRVVWRLAENINGDRPEVRDAVMAACRVIFPLDTSALDRARLFYGTNRACLHVDPDATVSPAEFAEAASVVVENAATAANASRALARLERKVGAARAQGGVSEKEGNSPFRLYYISETDISHPFLSPPTHGAGDTPRPPRDIDVPINDILERCELCRRMAAGSYTGHLERFGLMLSFMAIRGGGKAFLELCASSVDSLRVTRMERAWRDAAERPYFPQRCAAFCPHTGTCLSASTPLATWRPGRGGVQVLRRPEYRPADEVSAMLKETIASIMAGSDRDVHIVQAPCGAGKSESILALNSVLIACPTHRLKDEIAARCRAAGNPVEVTPELPEGLGAEHRARLDDFYRAGMHSSANLYLKNLAEHDDDVAEYLKGCDAIRRTRETLITTHARAIYAADEALHDTVIFDEDALLSVILPTGSVALSELAAFARRYDRDVIGVPDFNGGDDGPDGILSIIHAMIKAPEGRVMETPASVYRDSRVLLESYANAAGLTAPVIPLLFSKFHIRQGDTINFISRVDLPKRKKIIILSATANPDFYRRLYGARVKVHKLPAIEPVGRVRQITSLGGLSRTKLRQDGSLLARVKDIVGDRPVITFREREHDFANVAAHFGAVEGIDHLAGENIAVVGTPHAAPWVYALLSAALGEPISMFSDMRVRRVSDGWHMFDFPTFGERDGLLRDIQLWYIWAQLQQALGRARPARTNADVLVVSSYPVPGATLEDAGPRRYRPRKCKDAPAAETVDTVTPGEVSGEVRESATTIAPPIGADYALRDDVEGGMIDVYFPPVPLGLSTPAG